MAGKVRPLRSWTNGNRQRKEEEPAGIRQQHTNTTPGRIIRFHLAIDQLLANDERQQEQGRTSPERPLQAMILDEHPGDWRGQPIADCPAKTNAAIHLFFVCQHDHGGAIGKGRDRRKEGIKQDGYQQNWRERIEQGE